MSVIQISSVMKQYGALRPLRIADFSVSEGDQVAIVGLDQPAAEVFISLVTGASLPDTGSISIFGRATADIADSTDWLSTLDRFGIVSERAALLDPMSVIQNLAIPFSLEIEPPPPHVREQVVALAIEAGIAESLWEKRAGDLDAAQRMHVRLARALALRPTVLLIEHPSASLERLDVPSFARDVRRIVTDRGVTSITLTMDREYAAATAAKMLTLDPVTGHFSEGRFSRMKFWS